MAIGKVKNQPPDLTAGEFNRGEYGARGDISFKLNIMLDS